MPEKDKITLLLFLVISGLIGVRGQHISELEQQLHGLPDDTVKINMLLELGSHYCYTEADKALLYLQEALVLSTGQNYKKGIAGSFFWQGRAYYYKDEYVIATQYLEKARQFFEETEDLQGLMNYQLATGTINNLTGNYPNAIKSFQQAIVLSKQADNKQNLYLSYCGLGKVYLQRSELSLAKDYFHEALVLAPDIAEPSLLSILFSHLGRTHELNHKYDSALVYYEQSLQQSIAGGGIRMIASSEYNLGSLLVKTGQYEDALKKLEASRNKFEALQDDTGICINMIEMAKALFYTGKKDRSRQFIEEVFLLVERLDNLSLKSDAYINLAPVMAASGKHDMAYQYMVINNTLQDSLAAINKEKIIRELEMQFQTERKKDEIQLLKSQNEIQKKNILLLYVSLSGSLIILVLVFFLLRYKSKGLKRQKELYRSEKNLMKQEAEIREKEQLLLKEQLDGKKRELASKALEMLRINEAIGNVIEKLELFTEGCTENEELTRNIKSIVLGLESQLKNNSWIEFEKIFTNIHSGFFKKLLSICPELTSSEIKIAVLLKLNLNTKEIAAITFKSESAIKSTRYRLRNKLGLENDQSLVPYLIRLD